MGIMGTEIRAESFGVGGCMGCLGLYWGRSVRFAVYWQ